MTDLPDACHLSDDEIDELGITREQADYGASLGRALGPLTSEQRDQLAILLRPDPTIAHRHSA